MSGIKHFRKVDQGLLPDENGAAVRGLINSGFSSRLGAGIGVFENCAIEWTVSYDEVLFILEGQFRLESDAGIYHAGPGDTLWIPEGTRIVYVADAPVTFFYAVAPVEKSPSTGTPATHPIMAPTR